MTEQQTRRWACTATATVIVSAASPDDAMDLAQRHLPNVLTDMLERGHVVIEPFTAGEVLPATVVEDDDDD